MLFKIIFLQDVRPKEPSRIAGCDRRDASTQTTKDVGSQVGDDLPDRDSDREMIDDFVERRPVRRNCRLCGKRRANIRIKEELWDTLQEVRNICYMVSA